MSWAYEHFSLGGAVRVRYRSLGEIAQITTGSRPTDEQLVQGGEFLYWNGGVTPSGALGAANTLGETITIPSRGSVGIVGYSREDFWCGPLCYRVRTSSADVEERFLYFALKSIEPAIVRLQQTGSIPALNKKELGSVRVPVPPIEVQRAIVGILDTFTQLEAELEAELEARRRQFAFYRDSLLAFGRDGVSWVTMGEAGFLFGGLVGKSKADFSGGSSRFVSYVNVLNNIAVDTAANDFVRIVPGERQRELVKGDIIFTGSSETAGDVGLSSVVTTEPEGPLYLNSFCIGYRLNDPELLNPEFAKHLFRSGPMRLQIVGTANGVTRFNVSKLRLAKVSIPIPPKSEQHEIAVALDTLDALVSDLSAGLPAELAARRKQYEYYRDKLLTFEELKA